MGRIGFWEIILVGSIIIFLFGAKKIPEISSSLAKAIKAFKKESREEENTSSEFSKDREGQS